MCTRPTYTQVVDNPTLCCTGLPLHFKAKQRVCLNQLCKAVLNTLIPEAVPLSVGQQGGVAVPSQMAQCLLILHPGMTRSVSDSCGFSSPVSTLTHAATESWCGKAHHRAHCLLEWWDHCVADPLPSPLLEQDSWPLLPV